MWLRRPAGGRHWFSIYVVGFIRIRRLVLLVALLALLLASAVVLQVPRAGSFPQFDWGVVLPVLVLVALVLYLRLFHAVPLYSVLIAVLPRVAVFYNNRALGYLRHNDYERGLRDIERAIQIRPGMSQPYSTRGLFYQRQGRYEEAIQEYEQALRRKPRLAPSLYHAAALCSRASAWYSLRNYQRAIDDTTRALTLRPRLAFAYVMRSQALRDSGELERAKADADMAVRRSPRSPITHNARGLLHTRLGEYQLALGDFDHALARSTRLVIAWDTNGSGLPYRAMVLCNRAGTRMRMRDYARALEDCDQAIAAAPRYGYAHAQRGIACLGLSDLEGARAAFATGLAANQGFALNGLLLNWLDLSRGAPAGEVAAHLERVAATAGAYQAATPVCIGAARCLRQEYAAALPEVERALAWEPDGWAATFWLGMVRASSGQEDELAVAALGRAFELGMPSVLAAPFERAHPGLWPGQTASTSRAPA